MAKGSEAGAVDKKDSSKLTWGVWLDLLSSPWSLWPVALGFTALFAAWAYGCEMEIPLFASLSLILGGLGIFFTRYLVKGQALKDEALVKIQEEGRKAREKALDDLEARLLQDHDPRTEAALRDLRTLTQAFMDQRKKVSGFNAVLVFDLVLAVEQLREKSIQLLEKSLDLWLTAAKLSSSEARQPLLQQRERLVQEVLAAVRQLGKTVAEVQGSGGTGHGDEEMGRLRKEVDRGLEVARKVEEQIRHLDRPSRSEDSPPI